MQGATYADCDGVYMVTDSSVRRTHRYFDGMVVVVGAAGDGGRGVDKLERMKDNFNLI